MNEIDSLSQHLVTILAKCVVPLYRNNERMRPIHIGTGLLVGRDENLFLVSAAHVLRECESSELFFYADTTTVMGVTGKIKITPSSSVQGQNTDRLDVGVVKLADLDPNRYPLVINTPLPATGLLGTALPRDGKRYLLVGVPATKSRLNLPKRYVGIKYHALLCPNSNYEKYNALGALPFDSILLDYNYKKCFDFNKISKNFPDINGMSGSPIFLFDDVNVSIDRMPVVGILIEYHQNKCLLRATDIRFAIEIMNELTS